MPRSNRSAACTDLERVHIGLAAVVGAALQHEEPRAVRMRIIPLAQGILHDMRYD